MIKINLNTGNLAAAHKTNCSVYLFSGAAKTKYKQPELGLPRQKFIFSEFQSLENQAQGFGRFDFLPGLSP